MLIKRLLFFSYLILFITGCKKKEDELQSNCGVNEHFENGACICDNGWYGWNCDKECSKCGSHGHCYEDWCVCDSGWTGKECNIPIGVFVGRYHLTGSSVSWSMGAPSNPPVYIDDTVEVSMNKDTLLAYGYKHTYSTFIADTSAYFPFLWMPSSPSNYSSITFRKTLDDSLFYSSRFGGLGAGTNTTLSGKRID